MYVCLLSTRVNRISCVNWLCCERLTDLSFRITRSPNNVISVLLVDILYIRYISLLYTFTRVAYQDNKSQPTCAL